MTNKEVSKTGHWIAQDIHNCHTEFKCSECGYIHSFMHLYGKPEADYTYCPYCGCRMVESQVHFQKASKALEHEPCDDAVSRAAVLDLMQMKMSGKELYKAVYDLPPIQPKNRTGYWRAVYQGDEIIDYRCSECEFGSTFGKGTYRMNYCPNCGAEMK